MRDGTADCTFSARTMPMVHLRQKFGNGPARHVFLRIEQAAWVVGAAAMAVWLVAQLIGFFGARHEAQRFEVARKAAVSLTAPAPDQHLWSPGRVQAWRNTLLQPGPAPLALLRIARVGLVVPVLEGTDEWTLNRGVGHIDGTPGPGADGNSGIAGHRDGFFRGLKDVRAGDAIELETPTGVEQYVIERTWIVEPDDVSVLDATGMPAITLVTCYPFYFVGSAPQRFIVRAVRTGVGPTLTRAHS